MLKVISAVLDVIAILLLIMMFTTSVANNTGGIGYKAFLLSLTALLVTGLVYLIKRIRNKE